MPDLYSQTALAKNAQKVTHDTFNYGTPNIYPLVITRTDEGDWTGYANTGSDFFKVVNYMQGRGTEIYGIGEISGTQFTIFVNWNTLPQDNSASENQGYPQIASGDLDFMENEISNDLGIGVTIYHGKVVGDTIGYNQC